MADTTPLGHSPAVAAAAAHLASLRSRPQGVLLSTALAWLVLCTWMFHGALEMQLTVGEGTDEALAPPAERECTGIFARWCEQRVAAVRADAVRAGMQHAWAGYKAFAWGADEIHPQSKTAKTGIRVR